MKILVTGAAGFLGGRLVKAVLAGPAGFPPCTALVAADAAPCTAQDPRVASRVGSIADPAFVRSIVEPDVGVVYHLAAVLSGQSEAEFDTALQVNLEGTRLLLEACRGLGTEPRLIFSSTVAVFGGRLPPLVPESQALQPQTTYGVTKAIDELLVSEYSRRGFIDGISCRLATITVRPGKPNSALSSFVSGIVREPLAGIDTICPVPLDTPIWISSPATVIGNLVHAGRIETGALGADRALNLPGLSVTAGEILASLERVGGAAARARVRVEREERVARAMCGWPAALDASRALALGFTADTDVDAIVRQHIAERG
ncbi:MAG TPA: D-erythronate dehydrogenase [Vicinamibacterales bacterium]|jgi:nucleoside-diphosphate-sugar epimerase